MLSLILKDKERLLSFAEPVRFVFSHSALREGWDNPNVFVMGMLKKSDNTVSRRQEIGRGLRLSVDQAGARMDDPATVHEVNEVNELTVVTDESYTDFVAGLQREISDSLAARPRKATPEYFAGRAVVDDAADRVHEITQDEAQQLQFWLTKNDFIDYHGELTDRWKNRADLPEIPDMPEALHPFFYQLAKLIDSLDVDMPLPADDRKPKRIPLNDANFARREFQALWGRINRKAVYQVEFDSDELIHKAVEHLDKHLAVASLQFITEAARLINEQKATVIVEHLAYDALNDRFDSAIFTENQTKQDLARAGNKLTKHIYDYVVTDSKIERDFVTQLDTSAEVAVYAKLPRGFFIPTPVGDYNPDWAIAFTDGSVKHVYFVAETKGSLSTLQLRGVEEAKIECARTFFASLNEKNGQDVVYDVVTDYTQLMQLVAG